MLSYIAIYESGNMPALNIIVEREEYNALIAKKGRLSWRSYLLKLAKVPRVRTIVE